MILLASGSALVKRFGGEPWLGQNMLRMEPPAQCASVYGLCE